MSSKSYVGVAPFTVARTSTGSIINVLAGDPVPDGVDPDDLKRLVDEGFLAEAAAASSEDDGDKVPARSSSKADWVAYATDEARGEQRLSAEAAEADTRDGLAERYLGPKE